MSDFPALPKPNVTHSSDKSGQSHSPKQVHQQSMLMVGYSSAAAKPAVEQTVNKQRNTGRQQPKQQQQQRRNQKQVVVGL
jgi:hypothetical protein